MTREHSGHEAQAGGTWTAASSCTCCGSKALALRLPHKQVFAATVARSHLRRDACRSQSGESPLTAMEAHPASYIARPAYSRNPLTGAARLAVTALAVQSEVQLPVREKNIFEE